MSIKLMTSAWDLPLTGNKKLVLMALADFANDQGKCWPCIATIATKTGASESTVKRLVKELISDGYVKKEPQFRDNGSQSSNVYIITPVQNDMGVQNDTPPQVQNDMGGCGQNVPPLNHHTNHHKEPSSKKTSKKELTVVSDEEPREVAYYLYEKILTVQPNAKLNPESWIKDIEKAIRLDGRTKYGLIACIDWMYNGGGDFWIPNVMSGNKLRHKYDQMEIQAKRTRQPKISETDKTIARLASEGRL